MGFACYNDLVRGAFFARFMTGQVNLVRYLIAVMPDNLFNAAAHLAAICLVGYQYTIILVNDNKPLVYCVEDPADELLALPNFFLGLPTFGDVLSSTKNTEGFTGRIAPDNAKGFHHPLATIVSYNPCNHMVRRSTACQSIIKIGLHRIKI